MSRLPQLDGLRGFALLGVAAANVQWFSGYAVDPAPSKDLLGLDATTTLALQVLVDGKFYALFSLVFGASLSLMLHRTQPSRQRVGRRLVSLLVLGGVHASLLWFGDILSLYAVAALPLPLLLRLSTRRVLGVALVLLASPAGLSAAVALQPAAADGAHGPAAMLGAFGGADWGDLLRANAAFLHQRWVLALASGRLPRLLGLFLLGAWWTRTRPRITEQRVRRLVAVALLTNIGLVAVPGVLHDALACLALPLGALAYAAVLWPHLSEPGPVASCLRAAGRLSLTHYLGQSLIFAALFYGLGAGLWSSLGATGSALVGLGLAGTQVTLSPWLLVRFGLGPGERALRALDRWGVAPRRRPT